MDITIIILSIILAIYFIDNRKIVLETFKSLHK